METTGHPSQEDALRQHRRETLREVLLPVALGLVALILAVAIVAAISTRREFSVTADALSLLILCPLALCAFPLAIGLTVGAYALGRVHDWSEAKFATLLRLSARVNSGIDTATSRLARASIALGVRAAPVEKRLLEAIERPQPALVGEARHEPVTARRDHDTTAESAGAGRLED